MRSGKCCDSRYGFAKPVDHGISVNFPRGNGPSVLESANPPAEGVTDFATNNQEESVYESDFVKSDGKFVYVAYGDIVVIWNARTGRFDANYTLPPLEQVTTNP